MTSFDLCIFYFSGNLRGDWGKAAESMGPGAEIEITFMQWLFSQINRIFQALSASRSKIS